MEKLPDNLKFIGIRHNTYILKVREKRKWKRNKIVVAISLNSSEKQFQKLPFHATMDINVIKLRHFLDLTILGKRSIVGFSISSLGLLT